MRIVTYCLLGLSLSHAPILLAQEVQTDALSQPVDHAPVVTRHRGTFNGRKIAYSATVGTLPVQVAEIGASVRITSFAYVKDGADAPTRPVMFLFNGGPIVPSAYIHLGGLGPKRVAFPDDVKADPSTFRLVDNGYSPLDAVDLVFIDPASTGFSRVSNGTKADAFYSVENDARQFCAFIRTWLRQNGREQSPVYLMGESYGTNRAAEIAGQLASGPQPLPLAGVFLYGQAVNIIEYSQRPANVVSYVASLPTLAAIGWYHGKVVWGGRTLQQFIAEASAYAKGDYLTALYRGNALPEAEKKAVAARLEAFTGIGADWYLAHDLKITKEQARLQLLKGEGLLLGRSDARYTAPVTDKGGAPDPADVLSRAIEAQFKSYIRRDLGVDWKEDYVLSGAPGGTNGWGWGKGTSPFADWPYHNGISAMMALNPNFRLMIGNGYYDTMTTMGAAELLATQSGWAPERVMLRYYDGGHMGYSVDASAKAIADDIRAFVR